VIGAAEKAAFIELLSKPTGAPCALMRRSDEKCLMQHNQSFSSSCGAHEYGLSYRIETVPPEISVWNGSLKNIHTNLTNRQCVPSSQCVDSLLTGKRTDVPHTTCQIYISLQDFTGMLSSGCEYFPTNYSLDFTIE
jgi:hypothetical protein